MNDLQKMIMQELESLDEIRLIDVLGFIRFLKEGKSPKPEWMDEWLEQAALSIRERAEELEITPAQIQSQIKKL